MAVRMIHSSPTDRELMELLKNTQPPMPPAKTSELLKQLVNLGYRELSATDLRFLLDALVQDGKVDMLTIDRKSGDEVRYRRQPREAASQISTMYCLVEFTSRYLNEASSGEGRQLSSFEKMIAAGDVEGLKGLLEITLQLKSHAMVPEDSPAFKAAKKAGKLKQVQKVLEDYQVEIRPVVIVV